MSCNLIQIISGEECIGDSREKINNNFLNLEDLVCSLSSVTIIPTDTSTIDFIYTPETRILTAAVKSDSVDTIHLKNNSITTNKIAPNTVRYSQLASWQSLSGTSLSAEAITQRVAKAWVHFRWYTPVEIKDSFNVSSVTDVQSATVNGTFRVNFITPMNNNNYAALMLASDDSFTSNGGLYVNEVNIPNYSRSTNFVYGNTNTGANAGIDITTVSVAILGS